MIERAKKMRARRIRPNPISGGEMGLLLLSSIIIIILFIILNLGEEKLDWNTSVLKCILLQKKHTLLLGKPL